MSMGIPSATLGTGGGGGERLGLVSRKHKVAPSIAEQAIFIPKPHKRVSFKLQAETQVMGSGKGGEPMPALGQTGNEPIPLPGGKDGAKGGNGSNVAQGSYGANGLTAQFDKSAYGGVAGAGGAVKMEIAADPAKQHEVIATQEEGRQVNHKEIHFTQQYDAYGRPRIGFSREPYDFAATKFMSITSQVRFQSNMAKAHEEYDKYLIDPTKRDSAVAEETPIFGAVSDPKAQAEAAGKDTLGPAAASTEGAGGKKTAAEAFAASQAAAKPATGSTGDGKGDEAKEAQTLGKGEAAEGSDQNISGKGTVNVKA